MRPKVFIILLNWNGWRDTLECLESVFRLDYEDFRVVVCDNGSMDDSVQHILDWAAGIETAGLSDDRMAGYSRPPLPKPIRALRMEKAERLEPDLEADVPLVVIDNGGNLGFAAGCNVGLRYALSRGCEYAWLLNNDTVVDPRSLEQLIEIAEHDSHAGIVGSTVWRYYQEGVVQAFGGTHYNKWMARTPRANSDTGSNGGRLDCILGCSMLVRRRFLDEIGLMDESYFLYFEELDWAARAEGKFTLRYAPGSNVYHKEGASIGSSEDGSRRSLLSERYLSQNRILFTKRFHPWLLPSAAFWTLMSAINRLVRGDAERAGAIVKGAMKGFRK